MKAALYHRVSTLDQNPDLATEELRLAAQRMGADIVEIVTETCSGAKAGKDRPGLGKLLKMAEAGQIDCLLVWKLDRFGRTMLDTLANIGLLEKSGCRFICTSQGLDIGNHNPASKLMLAVLAAAAEFERDMLRERTRLGLQQARAKGKRLGRVPKARPPLLTAENVSYLRSRQFTIAQIAKRLEATPRMVRLMLKFEKDKAARLAAEAAQPHETKPEVSLPSESLPLSGPPSEGVLGPGGGIA